MGKCRDLCLGACSCPIGEHACLCLPWAAPVWAGMAPQGGPWQHISVHLAPSHHSPAQRPPSRRVKSFMVPSASSLPRAPYPVVVPPVLPAREILWEDSHVGSGQARPSLQAARAPLFETTQKLVVGDTVLGAGRGTHTRANT